MENKEKKEGCKVWKEDCWAAGVTHETLGSVHSTVKTKSYCMPVIPALWGAEAGRLQVHILPGQFSETLFKNEIRLGI